MTVNVSSIGLKGLTSKQAPPFSEAIQKDFCHVIGHEQAKRALEIAAAGEHNVLMSGPPGCGKSLLAETFPSILPSLTNQAQLEVMSLNQIAGELRRSAVSRQHSIARET